MIQEVTARLYVHCCNCSPRECSGSHASHYCDSCAPFFYVDHGGTATRVSG